MTENTGQTLRDLLGTLRDMRADQEEADRLDLRDRLGRIEDRLTLLDQRLATIAMGLLRAESPLRLLEAIVDRLARIERRLDRPDETAL